MRHLVLAGARLRRWVLGTALLIAAGFSGSPHAQCSFDVDANCGIDALTDGIMILRAGFGLTGPTLTQGALGTGATRTDPALVLAFINANKTTQYDLDGNGSFDALTDGLMILRYMFGLSGTSVTNGAIGTNPTRPDWTAVNGFLLNGCGTGPSVQLRDAVRLLTQATWGPKQSEVNLAGSPPPQVDNWITQQFALPRVNHIDWIIARDALGSVSTSDSFESFWMQALAGNDQLRQRIAYALSQILVVSEQKDGLANPWLISGYFDVLSRNAFGNFRTLLEEITKNPAMALWLDHMCNDKETTTRLPNENYAREILQLFSIGTVWLNQDGTPMQDAQNNPLPTYDQNVVQGFAKVFTGWSYSGSANWCAYPATDLPWYAPLVAFNSRHSISSKQLLSLTPDGASVVLPAQTAQTANAQADLTAALDNIFNHPNVGPYIGKQLIKLLVTSNPSPGYVSRVAAKFANNGSGVRGDMQAVIRAVLTDTDARDQAIAQGAGYGNHDLDRDRHHVQQHEKRHHRRLGLGCRRDGARLRGAGAARGQPRPDRRLPAAGDGQRRDDADHLHADGERGRADTANRIELAGRPLEAGDLDPVQLARICHSTLGPSRKRRHESQQYSQNAPAVPATLGRTRRRRHGAAGVTARGNRRRRRA
ncbi:MAG: DUF1800 family protein [Betaproteobacteria bacterium]|nr:DUF1800 family protein [Betaproteobacteria bacterium]